MFGFDCFSKVSGRNEIDRWKKNTVSCFADRQWFWERKVNFNWLWLNLVQLLPMYNQGQMTIAPIRYLIPDIWLIYIYKLCYIFYLFYFILLFSGQASCDDSLAFQIEIPADNLRLFCGDWEYVHNRVSMNEWMNKQIHRCDDDDDKKKKKNCINYNQSFYKPKKHTQTKQNKIESNKMLLFLELNQQPWGYQSRCMATVPLC
jgi:hypothetical protein